MKPGLRSTAQPRRCWLCLLRSTVTPRVYRIHIFGVIQLGQVGPRQPGKTINKSVVEVNQPGLLKSIKFRSAPQSSQMLEGRSRGLHLYFPLKLHLLKCSWAAETKGNLSNKGLSQKSSTDRLHGSSLHESASAVRHSAVSASAPAAIISPWMSLKRPSFEVHCSPFISPQAIWGVWFWRVRRVGSCWMFGCIQSKYKGTGDITLQIPWNRWTLVNCF